VGTEGKLGGQARVKGAAGTWKDLTDNVNAMATNLTGQVRNIAEVTKAVASGDLSKKITVNVEGEILELKNTINTMVDQLNSFASEVTRVAREVGTEGKLGGQARVEGVAGTWKDLTDNVNAMATNLTGQVRNIAEVTTAVAKGDLSKKITVDVKGEILELKNTINTMVDQLNSFASEVTRVAREVGTEGKLGGQAQVEGVAGTWMDLTDNVNAMATNLTGQVRNIAEVTTAVATGDLSKKITVDVKGEILELKNTINTMVDQLNSFASEVTRVAREVGTEGKLGGQARVSGVAGTWKDLTDNVNAMATNLTGQVRNIAEVTKAVATGDLSKKITVNVEGEILELKNTINTMVDQLNSFASEVTRVAREVGTEGKLGGQARVEGVAGTWKDLTDNVNLMATNLTSQVRGIADVVTAVANGNLKRKLTLDVKGEIAALAETINGMIETLATFADQVTNVAREVGIEGKLGGQAKVPGAAGLWRDLTDNVNQLAANLTTQVRAIAEVATAVTKGDLTRSIAVEALGEVAALKDNINEMIRNLKDTTLKNNEQDWLKTNLTRFTRLLQGERDLQTVSNLILSELAPLVNGHQALFYVIREEENDRVLDLVASYAHENADLKPRIRLREGLIGQCAQEKKKIYLTDVPDDFVHISSGLGRAKPHNVIVLPILFEGEIAAVIEIASFNRFNETHQSFMDQLMLSVGIVLNTIATNMRTEELLRQSQLLTSELQSQQGELKKTNDTLERQAASLRESEEMLKTQQEELRKTNEELEEKARLLSNEKKQVEGKNREVELAKAALEEKAEQLALTSRYKSEFLANMSHELRTPLNSLLMLSKLLAENVEGNLTDKQIRFARTIHGGGSELLSLINDILDLSKIESGTVTLDIGEMFFSDLRDRMERTFSQIAQDRKLAFSIEIDPDLPPSMRTDDKRLQQVVRNLLSNAFKFTEAGDVTLTARRASGGWNLDNAALNAADVVVAISVTDTGVGIAEDKQQIIFEAFRQADGTTNRKYGGTGLGLSISRELAGLLGGEIALRSKFGEGSTFTLFLPLQYPFQSPVSVRDAGERRAQTLSAAMREGQALVEQPMVKDDRHDVLVGDRVIVIVADDAMVAAGALEGAHRAGFKGLISTVEYTMPLVKRARPHALMLEIGGPDRDGWALLDLLRHDTQLRHLPVHVVATESDRRRAQFMGAHSFTARPVAPDALTVPFRAIRDYLERSERKLMVFARERARSRELAAALAEQLITVSEAVGIEDLLAQLASDPVDCLVVDLSGDATCGIEAIERVRADAHAGDVPIIALVDSAAGSSGPETLRELGERHAVRRAASLERLIDETTLCLHRAVAELAPEKQVALQSLPQKDPVLSGRKIIIIDDDFRNIFSLTSALEHQEMEVLYAETGAQGVEMLESDPDIDLALVDVMMPEMDGYETMRRLRTIDRLAQLPLIAVTAKAMKGDREKCIEAGASDYLAKPVDIDQLLSMLRVWLYR